MILGTKARYAVMAMVELSHRGGSAPVALAELAESQEIPLPYLEQIFARLRREQLVHSTRGPGGGYVLARSAAEISIAEIIIAADEALKMTRCTGDREAGCMPGKARCITHDLWEGLEKEIFGYLNRISLEDVQHKRMQPPAGLFMEAKP